MRSALPSSCWSAVLRAPRLGPMSAGHLDETEISNKGDVFIVIDGPHYGLKAYLDEIRALEPAVGFDRVLIPGERGRVCREQRLRDGALIADEVWERLQILAGTKIAA